MEKFNFKLKRVLDYKETVENMKKAEYGKARKTLKSEEDKLEHYTHLKNGINQERDKKVGNTTINDLKRYDAYLKEMNHDIKTQKNIVNRKINEVEKAKRVLVEASKDRKIFEKLREKDYRRYLYKYRKEEEKISDQIVCFNNRLG